MGRDVIVANGRVIDPANKMDGIADVHIRDGSILAVSARLAKAAPADGSVEIFDASGCIVTPGLIDAHVHVYDAFTPLGLVADDTCLARGVTTVVDAGSAGASTFPGLRKYIAAQQKTRVLALVHIALEGLAWGGMAGGAKGGELDNLNQVLVEPAVAALEANRDMLVGVKIRLTADIAGEGSNESVAYERAREAAARCKVPLMTHHAISSVPLGGEDGCPGGLRKGDVYTHTYHGWPSTIIEETGGAGSGVYKVSDHVLAARARGVLFDVGHGAGAFNWTVAEHCTRLGFWPDLISTDLHTISQPGPAYDLPTVMTKFLHLGMPLEDIVAATTARPAAAFGCEARCGSLSAGAEADVSVLRIDDVDVELEDCHRQRRRVRQRIVPVAVWRAGEAYPIALPPLWPDPNSGRPGDLATLEVRDPDWQEVMQQHKCC